MQTTTTRPTIEQLKKPVKQPSILTRIMNESICMPGFPQIIVTRGFLYQFLTGCGWSQCERGFGSLDYIVFAAQVVDYPLTDEAERDRLLNQVRDSYLREAA